MSFLRPTITKLVLYGVIVLIFYIFAVPFLTTVSFDFLAKVFGSENVYDTEKFIIDLMIPKAWSLVAVIGFWLFLLYGAGCVVIEFLKRKK